MPEALSGVKGLNIKWFESVSCPDHLWPVLRLMKMNILSNSSFICGKCFCSFFPRQRNPTLKLLWKPIKALVINFGISSSLGRFQSETDFFCRSAFVWKSQENWPVVGIQQSISTFWFEKAYLLLRMTQMWCNYIRFSFVLIKACSLVWHGLYNFRLTKFKEVVEIKKTNSLSNFSYTVCQQYCNHFLHLAFRSAWTNYP